MSAEKQSPQHEADEVVPLQCPISVFLNNDGGVTIEQNQMGEYGDTVQISMVSKDAVRAVIAALQRIGGV